MLHDRSCVALQAYDDSCGHTLMFCFTTERGLLHFTQPSLQMLTEPYQMGLHVVLEEPEAFSCLQKKGPFHGRIVSLGRPRVFKTDVSTL